MGNEFLKEYGNNTPGHLLTSGHVGLPKHLGYQTQWRHHQHQQQPQQPLRQLKTDNYGYVHLDQVHKNLQVTDELIQLQAQAATT